MGTKTEWLWRWTFFCLGITETNTVLVVVLKFYPLCP